jgi:hypothetical protein
MPLINSTAPRPAQRVVPVRKDSRAGRGLRFQVSSNRSTSRAIRTRVRNSHRSNTCPNSRRAPVDPQGFVVRHLHSSPRQARGYVCSPSRSASLVATLAVRRLGGSVVRGRLWRGGSSSPLPRLGVAFGFVVQFSTRGHPARRVTSGVTANPCPRSSRHSPAGLVAGNWLRRTVLGQARAR